MLDPIEIMINKIAQSAIDLDDGSGWFNRLSTEEKHRVIVLLKLYIEQTHPSQNTIDLGIDNIPLKTTMTPFVVFRTNPFKIALDKIVNLPEYEYHKSFLALMTIFKYSDTERRKTQCKGCCNHEWHNLNGKEKKPSNSLGAILRKLRGS
jgi:hypothetical protein